MMARLLPLAGLLAVALVWELTGRFIEENYGRFLFASLTRTLGDLAGLARGGELLTHLLVSARTLGLGFGIAALAGLGAGAAMATFPRLGRALGPLVIIGYATPLVALLPLLILALGIGDATKVAIAALLGVFPIAITAEAGLRNVDRDYLDTAQAFGAGPGKRLASVVLPAATVPVIAGLRLGLGRALIGTVVAEIYLADAGLGYLIAFSTNTLEVGKVLAVVLLLVALGVGLNAALEAAERRLSPWRRSV